MIGEDMVKRLHDFISAQGVIESVRELRISQPNGCVALVTVKSREDAVRIAGDLGLNLFGFNTLIVNEHWIRNNLVD